MAIKTTRRLLSCRHAWVLDRANATSTGLLRPDSHDQKAFKSVDSVRGKTLLASCMGRDAGWIAIVAYIWMCKGAWLA